MWAQIEAERRVETGILESQLSGKEEPSLEGERGPKIEGKEEGGARIMSANLLILSILNPVH